MSAEINEQRVTHLLSDLVKIESINPDLVPGGSGEKEIAAFLGSYLEGAGIEARVWDAAPGRPNVVGILRGTGGGRTLLIDAHTDTVSVEGMADPFSCRVEGGKLYGRGAADDKAGVAAAVEAIIALKESGVQLSGDVIVAGAADEEYASVGTEALVKEYRADGCIIGEPSRLSQGLNLGIGVGSGGFVWAQIETQGVAAHGSLHQVGVDAIEHMGPVLIAFSDLKKRLLAQPAYRNPLATYQAEHNPSLHASLIEGGVDLATYPERCLLSIERRLVYGETFDQARAELDDVLARAADGLANFQAEARVLLERAPWEAEQGPLLEILTAEVTAELGTPPARYAVGGWNDGALTSGADIPTVVFGPNGDGWHASGEHADVESLVRCARVMARTAIRFCKDANSYREGGSSNDTI